MKKLFLKWLVINVAAFIALSVAYISYADELHANSAGTIVAGVILAVFSVMSVYCGKLMWRMDEVIEKSSMGVTDAKEISRISHDALHVWWVVSFLQILGLLGTVVGFLILFGGFEDTGTSAADIKETLDAVAGGVGTALVATVVGISTSAVLGLQYHILRNSLSRHDET